MSYHLSSKREFFSGVVVLDFSFFDLRIFEKKNIFFSNLVIT